MKASKLAGAAGLAACLVVGPAVAEEQILRFRLVVSYTGVAMSENPGVPGHMVGAGEAVGVAVFEDGRIAFKNFVISMDETGEARRASGYSTYTFENGDSLNLKFTYTWTAPKAERASTSSSRAPARTRAPRGPGISKTSKSRGDRGRTCWRARSRWTSRNLKNSD